ncbi:TPA: AlwI family type II restriction endonuclease [Pasteurella multocida]|nr:AlwI family type II restriction endonuclease [Pasteurella multocida]
MAKFGERFLLGFTSPRNPRLLSEYVKVIKKYNLDGQNYDADLQEKFYDMLSKEQVAGVEAGNAKNKAFAGRDKLTRMPQALGFFITQRNKKFKITKAGELLQNNALFEDVMLHQILKYQLPSVLHKEQESNKGYFKIKPFLELLRLIDKLGYLTYNEFLTYGMTLTNYEDFDKVVNNILNYRDERNIAKKNNKSLRIFEHQNRINTFKVLYTDIIKSGNIKTRESETKTVDQFVKKKMNNLSDYADSIFRVIQSTGLVINSKGKSLQINPTRKNEVDYILDNVSRDIMPVDMDREDFDKYISDPRIPELLNDCSKNIINSIVELNGEYVDPNLDIYELKSKLSILREKKRIELINNQIVALKVKEQKSIDDILNTFNQISNKEIEPASMRPTYYEWNVWRAMTMINHGNVQGNFIVDDMGNPVSTAGGGKSDIIGDYGYFKIGIEVSLSTGNKQYEMEGEPVNRHIGELQQKGPAFGIFIADKLQDSVINYFYTSSLINSDIYKGYVNVIPMNTSTFITFFKKAVKKNLQPKDLYKIHEYSLKISKQTLLDGKTEKDWHNSVINNMLNIVS